MSGWLWAIMVIAVVVVAVLILATAIRGRRTERLREGFGPEYDRTVERAGDRQAAESELRERQARHDELERRPLAPLARKGYMDAWQGTQAEFVDDPAVAISDADRLIQNVMRDRGYPMEDFEASVALVSVDHPRVVERYRRAHAVAIAHADGGATPKTCGLRCRTTGFCSRSSSSAIPSTPDPTSQACPGVPDLGRPGRALNGGQKAHAACVIWPRSSTS